MVSAFTLAQSLRVIGEALDQRNIKSCRVTRNCENFLVQVKNGTPRQQRRYPAGLIKPRRRPLKIHYTLLDVYRRYQQGRCKRKNSYATPDFYSLPQVMRTVGEYLDCKNARLDWLYLDGIYLTVQYESEQGDKLLEQHTIPALYDFFVHMYLRRKRRMKLVA